MTGTRDIRRPAGVVPAIIVAMLAAGCAGSAPRTSSAPASTQTTANKSVAAPTNPATSTAAAQVDVNGTYRWTFTQEDVEAAGDPGQFPHTNTVVLKDGELEGGCFGAAGGTYEVDGDRITFDSVEYDPDVTVTFSVDAQGNLHLTPVPPIDPGTAMECFSKPWTKIN
jgi:hypothetical protein